MELPQLHFELSTSCLEPSFQGTKIPLQKWFLAIGLMVQAKKSLSSPQLARHLELNQKSAWFMQQRIRAAMASDEGALLRGIIEADETYVGGKPRYRGKNKNNKRGRGASGKTSVVGAVQREGEVRATVTDDTKGRTVLGFIEQSVEVEDSSLITDEYAAYTNAYRLMPHRTINHEEGYVDPDDKTLHTNTIEGFWSLAKAGVVRLPSQVHERLVAAVRRGSGLEVQPPQRRQRLRRPTAGLLRLGNY